MTHSNAQPREPLFASASSYIPHPEGTFRAVCCDVVPGEWVADPRFGGKVTPNVRIVFQTTHDLDSGVRATCGRTFGLTLHPMGKLRPFLEEWLGRVMAREELLKFDITKLLGRQAEIRIRHEVGNDGTTFARIHRIDPVPAGASPLDVESYTPVAEREHTRDRPPARGPVPTRNGQAAHRYEAPATDDEIPLGEPPADNDDDAGA